MLKTQLIGHLGQDPKVTTLQSGKFMLSYRVASTKKWKAADGTPQERTTWVSCFQYFEKHPKVSDYMSKGTKIYAEGEPSVQNWTSNSGERMSDLALQVFEMQLLDSPKTRTEDNTATPERPAAPHIEETATVGVKPGDDLPF